MVPQDSFVLNKTILENLIIVKPDATSQELSDAIRIAGLEEVIRKCPQGIHQLIGNQNNSEAMKLSGGEKQRLSIARAILLDKPIILIDEGFSSIDPETAQTIWNNLMELSRQKNKTVVIILHHIQPYMRVDRIINLEAM